MSILFELGRMERLAEDLDRLRRPVRIPVSCYKWMEGKEKGSPWCSTLDWEDCSIEGPWAYLDSHRWCRATVEIPPHLDGAHVEFPTTTGREGRWNATNPQMLFYLNGNIVQGVDVNHREILISSGAKARERYDIAILAYNGSVPGDLIIHTELVWVDDAMEKAYYDLLVPIQAARLLKKPDEENYRRILVKLRPVADALDLREPHSSRFYQSIEEMERVVEKEFYQKVNAASPVVSTIGRTHIGIAWLQTVEQTREKAVRSSSTVLELMDRYPDYKFMSGQPILYQFVKEQEPKLYECIRERVREGRWETDGATRLGSDCNLPAGGSLVRQVIKGEQFFQEEFDISSRCLWLPNVFGYSATIPRILRKCGISYFPTTKIAWNQFNQLPDDTFMWKGIDGSRVLVFMPTTCDFDKTLKLNMSSTGTRNTTTYTGIVNPNMTLGIFKQFQDRDLTGDTLMLSGFGDGGGGPTKEMLEEAKRLQYGLPGILRLVQENERTFLNRIHHDIGSRPDMSVWDGELYFEYHRGTPTSMGKNKCHNRKNEQMYEQLGTLGVMAELRGLEYPAGVMKRGWDIILLNQFHDIIPGSAIGPVYEQTDWEYGEILKSGAETALHLAEGMGSRVCGQDKDTSRKEPEEQRPEEHKIIVFNTQGYKREDTVTVSGVARGEVACACNCLGYRAPIQYVGEDTLIFHAKGIPSCGYAVYNLAEAEGSVNQGTSGSAKEHPVLIAEHSGPDPEPSGFDVECPRPWPGLFENSWHRAAFNDKMELVSLVEKETGCQPLKEGCVGNQLLTFENCPMNWDSWDVDMFYQRKPYNADHVTVLVLKEQGPVWTVMPIFHRLAGSLVGQDVVFYPNLPRIDFVTRADWRDHHVLLKVYFPARINATKVACEIQFGNVERETTSNHSWGTAKFEVCAHKWADLSENGLGLSLLNDCKYGRSTKDGEMGLTLIKLGTYPNENVDIGFHEFTYPIRPHKGRWQEARAMEMAYDLNPPLVSALVPAKGAGGFWSMVSVDQPDCSVEMMKKAENGNGYILRIYENRSTRAPMTVEFGFEISRVEECDLLERPLRPIETDGYRFKDFIKPYEIKTYRICSVRA